MSAVLEVRDATVRFDPQLQLARTIRQRLVERWRAPTQSFVALDRCSLTVGEKEVVGLIGRNGAGKSTLLRVLAGIVVPQAGSVLRDPGRRLVPLLELGIGFHPDLTGRENCLLSGALFGLPEEHVAARIGAIVEFAELAQFIDQPVKTYSSGMYARLAFSLATELAPDVLLLDEILGVGDQFFVRKSMARMQSLIRSGITVIMASQNLDFLVTQCDRRIWLEAGRITLAGEPAEVARAYRDSG
jgi:lipopolysaccharide transport system ATP-binding protein